MGRVTFLTEQEQRGLPNVVISVNDKRENVKILRAGDFNDELHKF